MFPYFTGNIKFAIKTQVMTEKKLPKADQAILNKLESQDRAIVLAAIRKLHESGNSAYLPKLIEILSQTDDEEIGKGIRKILSEIKHRDAVPILIEAIQNKDYSGVLQPLISACWENGLDYSNHLSLFIDLVIEGDFMVAFEAHTVIMNMSGKISQDIVDKESNKIKRSLLDADESKKQLLHDILDFLPVFEQGIEPQQF